MNKMNRFVVCSQHRPEERTHLFVDGGAKEAAEAWAELEDVDPTTEEFEYMVVCVTPRGEPMQRFKLKARTVIDAEAIIWDSVPGLRTMDNGAEDF